MLAATDGLLFARNGLPADTSVRERFMADSVRWHLDHSDPAERIVLVSVALTHTADHVPEMFLGDTASVGFTIRETPLAAPDMGSVEAAALDAGITTGLINLTTTHEQVHLDRMRSQSGYVYTAVAEAFDAVLTVPTATLDPSLGI
jgi:erythromycin esterase